MLTKDEQIKSLRKSNREYKITIDKQDQILKNAHEAFCIGNKEKAFSILDQWAKDYWN